MRLTRRNFDARVKVRTDPRPTILLSFGLVTFEATIGEATALAIDLTDAIEQARRGGFSEC
jgi:hypothetical protein